MPFWQKGSILLLITCVMTYDFVESNYVSVCLPIISIIIPRQCGGSLACLYRRAGTSHVTVTEYRVENASAFSLKTAKGTTIFGTSLSPIVINGIATPDYCRPRLTYSKARCFFSPWMCLLDQESNARSDRLGVGATPAKSGSWPHSLKCCTGQSSFAPKRLVFSSQFYLYTSLQEFYHLRTNLQKSCSLWAKQQERPWIEGSGSGMYSCTQRPDSNTQAQVLPSSFRGFEERKKKQNTLCKAVDSGWSWKIKVVKQVPWTTRYLLGFNCWCLCNIAIYYQCFTMCWHWMELTSLLFVCSEASVAL